ncbi:alpha-amylase [Halovulum dunhuangense]|uniref:Alpha-amylase n=1 Tax=Halovulum dunhuangense TaxID=1505036 RepID=A0A849L587_9RHOB|nr:amylosucrase [Halovulum dunhuangense]NNU81423.1 alpha-amylase [Halovulum dunhuangense]
MTLTQTPQARPRQTASVSDDTIFALRRARGATDLWQPLDRLYGTHPDFAAFGRALEALLSEAFAARPAPLRALDLERDLNPDWFLSPRQVGYVFYIDRFAGSLTGVLDHVGYLKELGVTYVHFMPCLMPREGANDGGYAVRDYTRFDPRLGTMEEFETVAAALRAEGIGVCLDMVLNHTASEHAWAEAARAGDAKYRRFYHVFDDETLPRQYEESLLEIFPDDAPGNFTFDEAMGKWVWTTFHHFQWDLNWSNPWVFLEILRVMLALLNRGAETLRLDAVAFMWKQMGTICQNLPPVHDILQALRAATRMVAPGTMLKAEAIVSPQDLVPYLGTGTHTGKASNLAYHNNLMVQFWSSLASRDVGMMTHVLSTHFPSRFPNATWGTYLRCHDDIGWAVTDEDAGAVGLNAHAHRNFLADFYEGVFPGSFARGGLFQYNPATGDKRNNGTCASLAGLERALEQGDPGLIDDAIARILMGHALIASFGGIPLIYMGDELGLMNNYADHRLPDGSIDSRRMQRPDMDWEAAARRRDPATIEGRIFGGVQRIMARRAGLRQLHGGHPTEILPPPTPSVLAFRRAAPGEPVVCLFNFRETEQWVPASWLQAQGVTIWRDRLGEQPLDPAAGGVLLPRYGALWIG